MICRVGPVAIVGEGLAYLQYLQAQASRIGRMPLRMCGRSFRSRIPGARLDSRRQHCSCSWYSAYDQVPCAYSLRLVALLPLHMTSDVRAPTPKRSTPRYALGRAEKEKHPWRRGRNSRRIRTGPQGGAHITRQPPSRLARPQLQRDSRSGGKPAPGTAPGQGHPGAVAVPAKARNDTTHHCSGVAGP